MASPMISHKELERLANLRSDEGILSVYLKIDPRLGYDRGQAAAKFKGALSRFQRTAADDDQLAVAEREKDRVLSFLEQGLPRGRSLAIFSSQPSDIWEVVPLDVMVPTSVSVDTTTHTSLLMQVLDEHPRFVVAVVQRDRAAIYTSQQRTADKEAEIESAVPGRHDQGGSAQARFQRHIEFHVERHLKKVVDEIEELFYERPFNRLVVGGSEEAVNELIGMLPDPLSRRVVGTFPVDLKHQTEEEVLDQARQVLREEERRSEKDLIKQIVSSAESGGRGVTVSSPPSALSVRDACTSWRWPTASRREGLPVRGVTTYRPRSSPDVPSAAAMASLSPMSSSGRWRKLILLERGSRSYLGRPGNGCWLEAAWAQCCGTDP